MLKIFRADSIYLVALISHFRDIATEKEILFYYTGKNRATESGCPNLDEETGAFSFGIVKDTVV
jgi:hypothetical protein